MENSHQREKRKRKKVPEGTMKVPETSAEIAWCNYVNIVQNFKGIHVKLELKLF